MRDITLMLQPEAQPPIYRQTDTESVKVASGMVDQFIDDKYYFIHRAGFQYQVFLIAGSKANDLVITDEEMQAFEVLIKKSQYKKAS